MTAAPLTGRLAAVPDRLLHEEVLAPQFRYEMAHLRRWYLHIEKILVCEYRRLGVIGADEAAALGAALQSVAEADLVPDLAENLADPAFAIERRVEAALTVPVPAWHVDRSRNDLQATAQVMAARDWVTSSVDELLDTAAVVAETAARLAWTPMPGQTQLQAAQTSSPGFHLAALGDQILRTARRLLATHDDMNLCPLGAGALTGQELAFDRDRMARLGGFAGRQPHALVSVASRSWALAFSADVSVFGVTLSRFATDLMAWGGGDAGYLRLPDELSGISSAMPQKRNYPVLERIRGRTAHLSSAYFDVALAQRNTPYSNMIEVSKESTAGIRSMVDTLTSVLRLLRAVLSGMTIDAERAREAVESEYLGGFTLANQLTLRGGVPWRRAQVIAGRYVTAALNRGLPPAAVDPGLLAGIAEAAGHPIADPVTPLTRAFGGDGLTAKVTPGAAHPDAVAAMLDAQAGDAARLREDCRLRRAAVVSALSEVDALLGVGAP
ncbi:hypothetical protein Afil01_23500 [Actinorhabdospora filicis]|uniref:argininosuccinate lyase n=1 Tax=Actinorhabdospora filicis TaxID=1785913 RepID=A0A9W6W911_9ACTN|nr:lyase family protein [Actinorhabdospora filicis]GLZ77543.1 hypothetical protein Afil01_23500 [Actinorhabdospora filicis]